MAYQTIYRLQAGDIHGQTIVVHISDTTSGEGTPTYIDLTLNSCRLAIENPEQDKHAIIKSTKFEFSFLSQASYRLHPFIIGENNRFLVEVFWDNPTTSPLFIGYLVTDETSEDFLKLPGYYTINMTATDGLASMTKGVPMTNFDGVNPRGYFKPAQFLAWCLKSTKLELPINTIDGICQGGVADPTTEGNWYNHTELWSKSFEKEINVSVSPYEALEIILKGRYLYQYAGEWQVVRVDEINGTTYSVYKYDFEGNYLGFFNVSPVQDLGTAEDIKVIGDSSEVRPERPFKHVQLTFPYTYPIEIIDNIDFSRGAQLSYDAGTKTGTYAIDDWTLFRAGGTTPEVTAYIRRTFEDTNQTYENERYVVIENGQTAAHWLRSNGIPVHAKDKISFSYDRKLSADHGGGGTNIEQAVAVVLVGNDGFTYYTDSKATSSAPAGNWTLTASFVSLEYKPGQVDLREWMTGSVETQPIPVDGTLYVYLYASPLYASSDETHFTNLNLNYIPYINGDYSKYTGQYHKVSQVGELSATIDDEVDLSDSPKMLFKGGLYVNNSGTRSLTNQFYNANATSLGELEINRFGAYQAFEFWHQHNREFRTIQANLLGLNSLVTPLALPSLGHTYNFTDTDIHTTNKKYMLLSYSMDLISTRWDGVFGEVWDTTQPKGFDDDHIFRYKQ